MNATASISILTAVAIAVAIPLVAAPEKGAGCDELRDQIKTNRATKQAHHKTQHEENKAFRQGLQDLEPDARIDSVIAHRKAQHAESVAVHQSCYEALVAAVNACEDLPAEKKAEVLERAEQRHTEAQAFHAGLHKEAMTFLSELKASDKTPKEKHAAMKTFLQDVRERVAAWRSEHHPKKKGA